jgi:hypothetical protein
MFLRFIIYCILAYIALRLVRRLISPKAAQRSASGTRRVRAAQMIRCETCGMFITEGSAILAGGRDFCSRACAEKSRT